MYSPCILRDLLTLAGLAAALRLPQMARMVRNIQQKRVLRYGIVPRTMAALREIPYHLTRTSYLLTAEVEDDEAEPFLLFFYEFQYRDAQGRLITTKALAFATKQDMERLFAAERIFVDGTFKIVAMPFGLGRGGQLLTLSTLYGDEDEERLYPRVFIFIAKKHEALYKSVLEKVLNKGADLLGYDDLAAACKWKRVTMDFESGLRNAFVAVGQDLLNRELNILGCLFHFVKVGLNFG